MPRGFEAGQRPLRHHLVEELVEREDLLETRHGLTSLGLPVKINSMASSAC